MDDVEGTIIENRHIAANHFMMKVGLERPLGPWTPGQFVMVKIPHRDIFLRRPFSIYDTRGKRITIMYKVAGAGTGRLSEAPLGTGLKILGPLGHGFSVARDRTPVVVAGGIGFAGVYGLIRRLGKRAKIFFGCSKAEEVELIHAVRHRNPFVATLDGSAGFKGTVVSLLRREMGSFPAGSTEFYACGPDAMVVSLKQLLEKGRPPCQVSLEERMACGLGLCFGCVKKTLDHEEPYKRVCLEGPVFNLWDVSL